VSEKRKHRGDIGKVPGHKSTKGSVRRNLYDIGKASKQWAKENADSLEVRHLSPEELAAKRSAPRGEIRPI
jgi:hypothetical protein